MLVSEYLRLARDIGTRDLEAKYKRSIGSWVWLFLTPVALLGIYWVVFAKVLNLRWLHPQTGDEVIYALPLFSGLATYLFLADIVMSSSTVFVTKSNYVRRSAFPIWILWAANLMRASTQGLVYVCILLLLSLSQGMFTISGLGWLMVGLVVIFPFVCGVSLLLASIGPFVGDIGEMSRVILRVLFYASPITYPLIIVPDQYRFVLWLNPLTHMVEIVRNAVLFETGPTLQFTLAFLVMSGFVCSLAVWVFHRVRGAIADVV